MTDTVGTRDSLLHIYCTEQYRRFNYLQGFIHRSCTLIIASTNFSIFALRVLAYTNLIFCVSIM